MALFLDRMSPIPEEQASGNLPLKWGHQRSGLLIRNRRLGCMRRERSGYQSLPNWTSPEGVP